MIDYQDQIISDLQAALTAAMPDERPAVRGVQVLAETVTCVVVLRGGRQNIGLEVPLGIMGNPAAIALVMAETVANAGLAGNVIVKVPDGIEVFVPKVPPLERAELVTKAGGPVELPKEDALSAAEEAAIAAEEAQLLADMAASQAAREAAAAAKPTTAATGRSHAKRTMK